MPWDLPAAVSSVLAHSSELTVLRKAFTEQVPVPSHNIVYHFLAYVFAEIAMLHISQAQVLRERESESKNKGQNLQYSRQDVCSRE